MAMNEKPRRKRQPVLVRQSLIDHATRIALSDGLAAVTVQAVSDAAGVTKGGFFHHFPSKQALVEGAIANMVARLDAAVDEAMAADPHARGRFTRAYVEVTFADLSNEARGQWSALYVSMLGEPDLRRLWSAWLAGRLDRHRDTDGDPDLEVVRLATDGVWLSCLMADGSDPGPDLAALKPRLLALIRAV